MNTPRDQGWFEKVFASWWGAAALIGVAVAIVYGNTLDVPFYLDDIPSIVDNPNIKDLENVAALWLAAKTRIIGYLTFALNFHFHGIDVTGYHLVNIFVHYLTGLAVFFLVSSLMRTPALKTNLAPPIQRFLPLCVALLFVLHPLQSQAVTYVVQRLTSLAALFYIGSMTCYVNSRLSTKKSQSIVWGTAAVFLALLALFTKQNTATLPLAWLLLEASFFRQNRRRLVFACVVLFLAVSATYVGTAVVFEIDPFSLDSMVRLTQETETISRGQYLATQGRVLLTYIRLFFWPTGQHLDWHYPLSAGLSNLSTLSILLFHGAAMILALACLRRFPLIAFSVCFFYLAHSVESSVIPIRDVFFEHRTYLPNLGLCMLSSFLALKVMRRWSARTVAAVTLVVLTALGLATWKRNSLWSDKIAFWQDNVTKSPDKARPYLNLGRAYDLEDETGPSITAFLEAIKLKPRYAKAHSNLGAVYGKTAEYEKAIFHFQKAIEIEPAYATVHNNLGTLYALAGRFDEAVESYRKALALEPQYARARTRLAEIYIRQGNYLVAEHELRVALLSSPNSHDAHNLLAVSLQTQGKINEAIRSYEQALRLNPQLISAYHNLGIIFTNRGQHEKAIDAFSEVLRRDPRSAAAANFVGLNLARSGRFKEAAEYFGKCLRIDPDHERAKKNLELAENETKNQD